MMKNIYRVATGIILLGFVMLIQPLWMDAFSWGLPVMIVGIVIYIVLDHLPGKAQE
ncbi:MAG: hypothetical protein NXI27_04250 [Alphaproteobacteria bacterium]|nr:hypothetical protein [Alphaproteobacteria bacterium]